MLCQLSVNTRNLTLFGRISFVNFRQPRRVWFPAPSHSSPETGSWRTHRYAIINYNCLEGDGEGSPIPQIWAT